MKKIIGEEGREKKLSKPKTPNKINSLSNPFIL